MAEATAGFGLPAGFGLGRMVAAAARLRLPAGFGLAAGFGLQPANHRFAPYVISARYKHHTTRKNHITRRTRPKTTR